MCAHTRSCERFFGLVYKLCTHGAVREGWRVGCFTAWFLRVCLCVCVFFCTAMHFTSLLILLIDSCVWMHACHEIYLEIIKVVSCKMTLVVVCTTHVTGRSQLWWSVTTITNFPPQIIFKSHRENVSFCETRSLIHKFYCNAKNYWKGPAAWADVLCINGGVLRTVAQVWFQVWSLFSPISGCPCQMKAYPP